MTKQDRIWIKLMEIGHWLGCHQMDSRSFSFRGYQFPVCARCTGVLIGEIAAILMIICGIRLPYTVILAGIGIMGFDWFIQYMQWKMSTNPRRLVTGLLCGVGVTYIYFYVFRCLYQALEGLMA